MPAVTTLVPPAEPLVLPERGLVPRRVHVFDRDSVDAVNAALGARRPLLVRGEPGTGKSQLAHAAAVALKRLFVAEVVDSRTEARDLMYRFDAVARLAEAQLFGALRFEAGAGDGDREVLIRKRLAERRFVAPGPLWWALDYESAKAQLALAKGREDSETADAKKRGKGAAASSEADDESGAPEKPKAWNAGDGAVLLIDEIDKAESDVPNGLLEALADGSFRAPGRDKRVTFAGGTPPLVVITTNEERALPDAFVRRCLVLYLELPRLPQDREAFVALLVARGRAHFPELEREPELLEKAADLLIDDRLASEKASVPKPGQAEYLDLLRAVKDGFETPDKRKQALARLARFTLQKHRAPAEV